MTITTPDLAKPSRMAADAGILMIDLMKKGYTVREGLIVFAIAVGSVVHDREESKKDFMMALAEVIEQLEKNDA